MTVQPESPTVPAVDLVEAEHFLTLLDDQAESFTFQTYGDRQDVVGAPRILQSDLAGAVERLIGLNNAGAAVCVAVNETDGKGRKQENIVRVRALFADFDGAPLPSTWPLEPHVIVESSPGHWHVYWFVEGLPMAEFAQIMRLIAERFGSDPNVCDLPHVMRLPGFLHHKRTPFRAHIVHESGGQPYGVSEIRGAFSPKPAPLPSAGCAACIATVRLSEAQLADLRNALFSMPADDRADWIANGHRLVELGEVGRSLWIEWSQTSAKWQSGDERQWDTFKPDRTGYRAVFAAAQSAGWHNPASGGGASACVASTGSSTADVDAEDLPPLPAPSVTDDMYYGLVGDVMRAASDGTEVHPGAAGLAFMSFAATALGRECYVRIGNDTHHPRLFTVHVGRSSIAGKGMALTLTRRIRERCEQAEPLMGFVTGNFHDGGLSSREGLAYMIRDASDEVGKDGLTADPGVLDKRLFVIEEEFANVLAQAKREGNTLSPAMRTAWDGHDLAPATKANRTRATRPHIGVHACITPSELGTALHTRELTNGFANRFLFCWAERQGIVAFPVATPDAKITMLAQRLADAIACARNGREIQATPTARELFASFYRMHRRGRGVSSIVRGLLDRYPPYAWRIALVLALLDQSATIEEAHMRAALAWLAYCKESTKLIFSSAVEEAKAAEAAGLADRIVTALTSAPSNCMTREDLRVALGKPPADRFDAALEQLDMAGGVEEVSTARKGGGRPARRYQLKLVSGRVGRDARHGSVPGLAAAADSWRIEATRLTDAADSTDSPQIAATRLAAEVQSAGQVAQFAQVATTC